MELTQVIGTWFQNVIILVGFIYTILAFKKSNDANNVNFIINAEGQVDPLYAALLEEDTPEAVHAILPLVIPQGLSPAETKSWVYTYFAYRHLSRIIYMLSNDGLDLGMKEAQRRSEVDQWLNDMKKFDQSTVQAIHARCRATGEFNGSFVALMDARYPEAAIDEA